TSRVSLPSHQPIAIAKDGYRVAVKGEGCWRYELAGERPSAPWSAQARAWIGTDGEWLEFKDTKAARYRAARIDRERLSACLFVAPTHELPARAWLQALFQKESVSPEERLSLLSGRTPAGTIAEGSI